MELVSKLRQRAADGDPIRIGIVGCGQMGSGLAHTINNVEGMRVAAIADLEPQRGVSTFGEMGRAEDDIEVAEKLVQHVPCAEKVKFCVTGTEAVQLAIRLARAYTNRPYFIRFGGHYHGWMDNVLGGMVDPDPQGKPGLDLRDKPAVVQPSEYGDLTWPAKFTPSYRALVPLVRNLSLEPDRAVLTPCEFHADTTELVQMLRKGHHGVQLDAESWDRLSTWIDLNCPAHGTWHEAMVAVPVRASLHCHAPWVEAASARSTTD